MAYKGREKISPNNLILDKPNSFFEQYKGKPFDEVLAIMANDDNEKVLMATSIIEQIKVTADPSSLKILLAALERQGFSNDKELPITDERFFQIIKTFSRTFSS